MIKPHQISLEGCDTCENHSPHAKAAVNNQGTTPGAQDQGDSVFTYDEGKGIKDKVLLTGPLGEVYTQALNVYFAKKPLDTSDVDEESLQEIKPAVETLAIDEYLMQKALRETQDAQPSEEVDFLSPDDNAPLVNTTGYVVSDADILKPEIIEHVNDLARAIPKPLHVVVVTAPHGEAQGMHIRKRLIEVDPYDNTHILFKAEGEEKLALEALFDPKVKLVNGMTAFLQSVGKK